MNNSSKSQTSKSGFLTGGALYSKSEDLEGKQIFDVYDEGNMKTQDMFTATQNQFNNPNYTPDMSIGLEDESFLFLPSARVANKTIGASAVVTKELSHQADKIYLQTGIKTDSFLRRNIHENASKNTVDFLNGFDSKYPKVNNLSHTMGYTTRFIIKNIGN